MLSVTLELMALRYWVKKMSEIRELELRRKISKEILDAYQPQEWDVTNLWGRALEFAASVVAKPHLSESIEVDTVVPLADSNPLFEGVTTKAGRDLISYMNINYGSSIWGKVALSVKEIESEMKNERL